MKVGRGGATTLAMADGLRRAVMIFDGRCAFCRRWVERWREHIGIGVDFEASQEVASKFPQIEPEGFKTAVYLVEPDGRFFRGAEAVFRALAISRRYRWLYWMYRNVPGFAGVSKAFYGSVAGHRDLFDWLDLRLIGTGTKPASYRLTQQVFLRLLGLVY